MARGRRTNWVRLVKKLDGTAAGKARLETLLATAAGQQAVAAACAKLGVSERRFHTLRNRFLQAALAWLEPRAAGRRKRPDAAEHGRVAKLQEEIRDVRAELRATRIREEIALSMPHLLRRTGKVKKATR